MCILVLYFALYFLLHFFKKLSTPPCAIYEDLIYFVLLAILKRHNCNTGTLSVIANKIMFQYSG